MFLFTSFQPRDPGNDRENNILNNAPKKRLKHRCHACKLICPRFRKTKKINFLMSLKRPVSDTIRKIPDFEGVRRGVRASCVDMAEVVTLKIRYQKTQLFRPLQGVICMCKAIRDGFGKVKKSTFELLNFDTRNCREEKYLCRKTG